MSDTKSQESAIIKAFEDYAFGETIISIIQKCKRNNEYKVAITALIPFYKNTLPDDSIGRKHCDLFLGNIKFDRWTAEQVQELSKSSAIQTLFQMISKYEREAFAKFES